MTGLDIALLALLAFLGPAAALPLVVILGALNRLVDEGRR